MRVKLRVFRAESAEQQSPGWRLRSSLRRPYRADIWSCSKPRAYAYGDEMPVNMSVNHVYVDTYMFH
jgi:hypothetical protein